MQSPLPQLWKARKNIVGMVHLLPLPGAPRYRGSMQEVTERAVLDARALVEGGVDGIIVENYGDVPFYPDEVTAITISALTLAVAEVRRAAAVPVGVNVLRNDALAALSIAAATGAAFIRVNVHTGAMLTDQGWIAGKAFETVRRRAELNAPVAIFADVLVKHAVAPAGSTIEAAARDAVERGCADALIVSGAATGSATDVRDTERVKQALPDVALWIGSGVTVESAADLLEVADGIIVGSAFERNSRAGQAVVATQVKKLVEAVRQRHS